MSMSFLLMFCGNLVCFLLGCLYSDWKRGKAAPIPITNADRIRSMSDDELAELVEKCAPQEAWASFLNGRTWSDWLKQEASE
jgi:hypothetical protein